MTKNQKINFKGDKMKRNDEFILKEVAGTTVLIPFGSKSFDINGLIKLNETAKFLWEHSEDGFTEESLTEDLMREYGIDRETAAESVKIYIEKMREVGSIE